MSNYYKDRYEFLESLEEEKEKEKEKEKDTLKEKKEETLKEGEAEHKEQQTVVFTTDYLDPNVALEVSSVTCDYYKYYDSEYVVTDAVLETPSSIVATFAPFYKLLSKKQMAESNKIVDIDPKCPFFFTQQMVDIMGENLIRMENTTPLQAIEYCGYTLSEFEEKVDEWTQNGSISIPLPTYTCIFFSHINYDQCVNKRKEKYKEKDVYQIIEISKHMLVEKGKRPMDYDPMYEITVYEADTPQQVAYNYQDVIASTFDDDEVEEGFSWQDFFDMIKGSVTQFFVNHFFRDKRRKIATVMLAPQAWQAIVELLNDSAKKRLEYDNELGVDDGDEDNN